MVACMTTPWWSRSALELAKLIRDKNVSSREVVEAHLQRIEEVNPKVNAVVRVMAAEALKLADERDKETLRGTTSGPLHGVPYTVKDNIDIAGLPTTQGIPALAEAVPTNTSPVVERMNSAGAIVIARTNLPDLGLRIHTDSSLFGRTKNPWNADRTVGGSSGGEAAALATGMSPIGLGNDIGGSLRNPAHCCGIASIKPSLGVIPDTQTFPVEDFGLSAQLMLNQGVMARRIADVREGFRVVAGPSPRDPVSAPVVLRDLDAGRRLRVAVMAEPPGGSTHPGIAAVVRDAARALHECGHDVVETVPPSFEEACRVWSQQLSGELTLQIDLLDAVMGEGGRKFLHYTKDANPPVGLAEWSAAQTLRNGIARRWSLWFEEYDALVCPVWTQPPFVYDADIADMAGAISTVELMRAVLPPNLLGLPAAVVSAGMADGLPAGIQVIGARYTDLQCMALAEQVERACAITTPVNPTW
jgi:amidase